MPEGFGLSERLMYGIIPKRKHDTDIIIFLCLALSLADDVIRRFHLEKNV